jgi:hypothetical protein
MRRHRVHQECQDMKLNCDVVRIFNEAKLCDLSRRAGGSAPYILNFCTALWRMLTFISWLFYLRGGAHLTLHPAFEDGTDRGFRNVGKSHSDSGEIPKRIYTIFKTRRKFEIKKE